jgi:large subunit ribosomal protein L24
MNIRNGDTVQVLVGEDKGKRGQVTAVNIKKSTVTIQGINVARKHIKKGHPQSPQGGRLDIEVPMHACKVALIDPTTNKPTRVGYRYLDDGSKERYARKSGTSLGLVSPPKASRAKKS